MTNKRWAARRREPTEYGGGEGDNRMRPGRVPQERPLTAQELARDMRREGLAEKARPSPRTR